MLVSDVINNLPSGFELDAVLSELIGEEVEWRDMEYGAWLEPLPFLKDTEELVPNYSEDIRMCGLLLEDHWFASPFHDEDDKSVTVDIYSLYSMGKVVTGKALAQEANGSMMSAEALAMARAIAIVLCSKHLDRISEKTGLRALREASDEGSGTEIPEGDKLETLMQEVWKDNDRDDILL